MARRRAIRIAALTALVAAGVAVWAVLAPPELGGSTRYVVTQGSSMEPALHAGDLALVRETGSAGVGDVVLYEHPRLDAHVLHRIVRTSDGRFVLKGDSNDFLDDVRPSAEEIDGKLWFSVPRVGSALMWAREPVHLALIVFALAFVALGGGAAVAGARDPARVRLAETGASESAAGVARVVLVIGLVGVALFGLLTVMVHSRADSRAQAVPDAYAHVGTFSYGAAVEPSDVYPDGHVDTGEAVFLSLVRSLDVAFSYRLEPRDADAVRGTTTLRAVLSDGAGWTREIPLAGPADFVGTTTRAAGSLDVESLAGIVEEMKALTGSGTTTFALGLAADVAVRGRVDGAPFRSSFSPELPLLLDTVSLRPDSAGVPPTTVRKAEAVTVEVPASLTLGGLRVPVGEVRWMSLVGFLLAALVAAGGALAVRRTRTGGEPSQIAVLFGDRLITIGRPPGVEPVRVTELRDAESLVRLAEHRNRVVLHWREGRDHVYEVEDGGSVYRYRTSLGLEPGPAASRDEEDTLVLPPAEPPRAATG